MFKLGKYTRSALRVIFYSIGLTVFLDNRWIVAGGNFLDNVIAGVVLYFLSWFGAFLFASFFNGGGK
jgi:hypothetical protein